MANINLNNYFRKTNTLKSEVDSNIVLNKTDYEKVYYGDLRLDLKTSEIKERALNAKENNRDLQIIVNEESIITALRNIFNTYKGSRLLNPDVSFDIKQYLFEPITATKAWFLGYDICQSLPMYEPRIKIANIEIAPNVDDGSYTIKLAITIPSLNKTVNISSLLSQDGYYILG